MTKRLEYQSLPYITHPIDIVIGHQGWGPFNGPWSPIDFFDPAADISIGYGAASNAWQFTPRYTYSIFGDPSLDYVDNAAALNAVSRGSEVYGQSSTIGNVLGQSSSAGLLARIRSALGI